MAVLLMAGSLSACATFDAFVDTFIEKKTEPEETDKTVSASEEEEESEE